MADGQYKFGISLDTRLLQVDINEAKKMFESLTLATTKVGKGIDDSFVRPLVSMSAPLRQIPAQVNDASRSFNGLNVATQQLVRELPAASMGLNTLFLAMSNNLPIFADQIKNLRNEGQSMGNIFSMIGKSLLSWQTALVAGITILSMYGKDIANWVVELFKGKTILDDLAFSEMQLNDVRTRGLQSAEEEVTKMRLMVSAAQDATSAIEERRVAVATLQGEYPEYFGNLTEEQILYGDLTDSLQTAIDKTIELAEAREAFNTIVENENKRNLIESTPGWSEYKSALDTFNEGGRQVWQRNADGSFKSRRTEEYKAMIDAQDYFLEQLEESGEEANKIWETIDDDFDGNLEKYLSALDAGSESLRDKAENLFKNRETAEERAAKREAEARARQLANESKRLAEDAERATAESRIAAMREGINKELAQIDHDYNEREKVIAEREKKLRELRGGMLTAAEQANLDAMRKANEEQRQRELAEAYSFLDTPEADIFDDVDKDIADATDKLKKELAKRNKAWEDYAIEYGTYKERLLATQRRYDRLIAEAETVGQRLALEAERDAILAQFEVEASAWAKELVGKTTEQLNTMLDELEKTVAEKEQAFQALDNSQGDDAKTLRDKINELNAQIAILKERLGEADDAVANDNWADATQVFQSVAKSAAEAAQSIAEFDERLGFALNGIAQLASLSVDVIGALQGVKTAFEKTGEAASAMEKASAILAVISVAIKAVSAIFNVMKDNEEATRNATLAAYEYAQAFERIRNEELRGSFSTIFGKDEYGEMLALLDKSKAQLQEIEKQRRELAKTTENAVDNLGRSGSLWANFGGLRDTMNEGYNYDEALVADMRSGWQKFWGSGNDNIKYTSLDEFYEDGKLNVDKLKAYYDTYKDYLTEEQADLVKSLIDTGELYEENMQAISDYMSGIFGELGDDITNSIVDAFANGTDAAEAFRDSVSDIMRNFAADMVENMYIAPLLEQAQKDVEAIWADDTLSHEQKLAAIAARMAELGRELNDTQDDVNASLDLIDKAGKGQGFDIFDGADRKGTTKSGIQATQDSIDELTGRATAIQSHTYALANGQKQLIKDSANILNTLTSIEVNTRELHAMRKDMAMMRSDINTITTRGIKAL